MTDDLYEHFLGIVLPHATRPESQLHGLDHWRRVAINGAELADKTEGADATVVMAFAALHDSQRENEYVDANHGPRAAVLADRLDLGLTPEQQETLVEALYSHDRGQVSSDPTIGCCWDADRLDLPRVGVVPRAEFFSTEAGRRKAGP